MKVATLNCNKRLTNKKAASKLEIWLEKNQIDLLLAQEPWNHGNKLPAEFLYYKPLGGNSRVFAWIKEGYGINNMQLPQPYWQIISLDYILINNLYLDAYKRTIRGEQLNIVSKQLASFGDQPQIIVGDFNIAPSPEDGLTANSPSNFNGPEDRMPLTNLNTELKLIDTTSKEILGQQEFTIIKKMGGSQSRFRCDLCLVSDYLYYGNMFQVKYDHSVRVSESGFTDHSAVIFDVPVTLTRKKEEFQRTLFPLDFPEENDDANKNEYFPHKTAMARTTPSPIAKLIGEGGLAKKLGGVQRILDYGCGRGRDVEYYRKMGFDTQGFDQYPAFGFSDEPSGLFDLVCIVFVINVLPNCWERLQVIKKAAEKIKLGGYMIMVARSPETIEFEASSKGWKRHNDGYWSHEGRGTFQKGISIQELKILAERAGLKPHQANKEITLDMSSSWLLVTK